MENLLHMELIFQFHGCILREQMSVKRKRKRNNDISIRIYDSVDFMWNFTYKYFAVDMKEVMK